MSEWAAAGRVAGQGLGAVVDVIAGTHDAIAQRVESSLPPGAAQIVGLQRAHAVGVYRVVGAAHRRLPAAVGRLAPREAAIQDAKPVQTVLPVLNGLWGDHLAAAEEPLAIQMSLREDAGDSTRLGAGHLVFFVHGLFEDERAWECETGSFGSRLEEDLGVAALHVRYNSGLRISDNGEALSALIERTVQDWPGPVSSIALVGHSMGGLVARSAAQQGGDWTARLTTVVTLGTPHLGSPVEKSVHLSDWTMRRIPEARALGDFLARRSVGIKDLRFGAIVREDWDGHDPDEFLRDRCTEVPLLDHVTYYWVAATIAANSDSAGARMFGDGLVREASASGNGRVRRIPFDAGVTLGGINHLAVMRHDAVYQHVLQWVSPTQ